MKVVIKNKEFLVKFKHTPPNYIPKDITLDVENYWEKEVLGKIIFYPTPFYGSTECSIKYQENDEWKEVSHGITNCSRKDQFVRRTGREKSLSKCLNNSTFSKSERELFWKEFLPKPKENGTTEEKKV